MFFNRMILKGTTLSPLPSDLKHALFSLLLDWLKCIFGKGAPAVKTETRSRGPSNGSCRQVLLDATLCYDHNVRNSHHPDKFSLRISSHVLSWACVHKYTSGICKECTEPVFSLFTWQHKNWVLSIQWYSAENSGHFQGRIILSKKYHWIPQHLCPSNKASMQQLCGTTTFLTN